MPVLFDGYLVFGESGQVLPDHGAIAAGEQVDLLLVDGNTSERVPQVTESTNHRLVMKAG